MTAVSTSPSGCVVYVGKKVTARNAAYGATVGAVVAVGISTGGKVPVEVEVSAMVGMEVRWAQGQALER